VGRTLLSAAFEFDVIAADPLLPVRSEFNVKFNGGGRGRPPHTGTELFWNAVGV
jgi:hypothetical protein